MPLPSDIDIAIIGAGAAGLAAARALENSDRSVLVLEARDRIGGRSQTVILPNDIVFDVGCGWLHSADKNGFVDVARELGFEIAKERPPWQEQAFDIGFPRAERAKFQEALEAFYDRLEQAAEREEDGPASAWLEPWQSLDPMMNAVSSYVNGCELDTLSVYDLDTYEDTGVNWRVRRGYGALIAAYGASVPVALNAPVTLIDHSGSRLRIETPLGALTADKVIVTVPTNLIARETIRFSPALPAKVAAAAGLPLGIANKTMLALEKPDDLPVGGQLRGGTTSAKIGTYHLRPHGQPCIEGYFGGTFARELEEAGDGALAQHSIDEIVRLLGSDYRARLKPLRESHWVSDPFATGSYSHALPGHADERAALAAPVDGRIFFAGEATSPNFFSTAHGAKESGERAAREALAG